MPKIISGIILFSIVLTPCFALAQEMLQSPPAWQNIWNWAREKILFVWDKIYVVLSKEVEQRKPSVEHELKKETEEIKQEIKKEAPSLWQRFLDLIK
ncbi:hypothetical protein AMJ47_03975 [Parcubacteria bacterium DG_72]|nr:MAG: hypothetical protein AMJ47_03975 [Parcubacteria bacterium DG_72]